MNSLFVTLYAQTAQCGKSDYFSSHDFDWISAIKIKADALALFKNSNFELVTIRRVLTRL